jgi:hypothetical protein
MSSEQQVSVIVEAISQGYYKGKVINPGEKFLLECKLHNGKFPLWVKVPEEFKATKKAHSHKNKNHEVNEVI